MKINPFNPQIILSPAEQQPTDLVLAHIECEIARPVTILQQSSIRFDNMCFTFYIIGESHIVRVERDGVLLFQEILACIDLPACDCLHYHRFDRLERHAYLNEGYRIQVDFYLIIEVPSVPLENTLEVAFPEVHGQIPITRVLWQRVDNLVYWWTLHTYPNWEQTRHVYTFSTFSL